jgi:hypothetical protein
MIAFTINPVLNLFSHIIKKKGTDTDTDTDTDTLL